MSDAEAGIGAGLELGPVSLKGLLDLQASINGLTKIFTQWKTEEGAYEYGALESVIQGSGVYATATDLVLDCGGPNQDRMWEVRRLAVGAPNPETAVAGVAYFYVSAHQPSKAQPTIMNFVDWTGYTGSATFDTELPSVAFYGTRQVVLHAPNHLFCVINSGVNLQQYAVSGMALDFPDRRRSMVTDI